MMYLKWALFAPISLVMNILTWILAPFLALLSMATGPVLPWGLWIFHTHDDDLDGGQHQKGWPPATGVSLWWQRTCWMYRNPSYGFDAYVLGFGDPTKITEQHISGVWDSGKAAEFYCMNNGTNYFSLRKQVPLGGKRYIKIWIGWKHNDNGTGRHMFVVDFNPFKTVE